MFSCHGVEGPAGLFRAAKPEQGAIPSAEGLHQERQHVPTSFGWEMEARAGKVASQGCGDATWAQSSSVALHGDTPLINF